MKYETFGVKQFRFLTVICIVDRFPYGHRTISLVLAYSPGMSLDNISDSFEAQGYRSKVKVTRFSSDLTIFWSQLSDAVITLCDINQSVM